MYVHCNRSVSEQDTATISIRITQVRYTLLTIEVLKNSVSSNWYHHATLSFSHSSLLPIPGIDTTTFRVAHWIWSFFGTQEGLAESLPSRYLHFFLRSHSWIKSILFRQPFSFEYQALILWKMRVNSCKYSHRRIVTTFKLVQEIVHEASWASPGSYRNGKCNHWHFSQDRYYQTVWY